MGLFETMLGFPEPKGYDIEGMANYRLSHGLKSIDWKVILLNQIRAEQLGRQLTGYEQFLLESLTNG